MHQTRRMLFMAHGHVAENPFHAECLKLIKKLREAPDQTLPHSVLLKRMKLDAKTFQGLIETSRRSRATSRFRPSRRPAAPESTTGCWGKERSTVKQVTPGSGRCG